MQNSPEANLPNYANAILSTEELLPLIARETTALQASPVSGSLPSNFTERAGRRRSSAAGALVDCFVSACAAQ